jgi:RHS repeat-associated protein
MDGNLMDRSDGLHIDYDAADHTVAMVPPAISGGAAAELTMKYTGLDQTQRTFLKRRGATPTTFTYDQTGIGPSSQQPGAADASPNYFTRTPSARLISLHRGDSTFYYIRDRLESVIALAGFDPWTGTTFIANRYRYSSWGEILVQKESVPQPFKFAEAEHEVSTGLYKMGTRYYDPAVGRFTQLDLFGDRYLYVQNDPVNLNDPTGYAFGNLNRICSGNVFFCGVAASICAANPLACGGGFLAGAYIGFLSAQEPYSDRGQKTPGAHNPLPIGLGDAPPPSPPGPGPDSGAEGRSGTSGQGGASGQEDNADTAEESCMKQCLPTTTAPEGARTCQALCYGH